jgi:hypothetical protein
MQVVCFAAVRKLRTFQTSGLPAACHARHGQVYGGTGAVKQKVTQATGSLTCFFKLLPSSSRLSLGDPSHHRACIGLSAGKLLYSTSSDPASVISIMQGVRDGHHRRQGMILALTAVSRPSDASLKIRGGPLR